MPESSRYVAENVKRIREAVAKEAAACSRSPEEIRIMAVTKTVAPALVNEAIAAGINLLGENKAQELLEKYDSYHKEGCEIHFIGHLQTNKVKQIVGKVSLIESVDSLKLAEEVDRQSAAAGKIMKILIEVNIGKEKSKGGVFPEQLHETLEEMASLKHILVCGLMTIPPICENEIKINEYFYKMYKLFVDMRGKKLDNINMELLSMGMSQDYLAAVRQGSNILRVGTAMFGRRSG